MTTIYVGCETCGDLELKTADIRVRVCIDDNRGEYRFRCGWCGTTTVKTADPRTIDFLVASGVQMETWNLPSELHELRIGPPINHDDLVDFHDHLHDPSTLAHALDTLRSS